MAAKVEEPHYLPTNTAWPICSICCEAFSIERIPLLLLCCESSVCILCFENRQASELAELDATTDIWYKCPCSNCPLSKNTGYKRSGKCYVKNRALMEILNIDAATSSTAVNPNDNIVRPNNISVSANPNVVSPTAPGRVDEEEDNIGIEIIDLTQHDNDSRDSDQPHTSTGTIRRSQRTRRPAQRNLTEDTAADIDNDDDVETQTSNQETNTSLRRSKRQSQPADGQRSRRTILLAEELVVIIDYKAEQSIAAY
eukprot:scaffold1793_cov80-Skeletonema_dohrnii-CCMP3373.AAC.2